MAPRFAMRSPMMAARSVAVLVFLVGLSGVSAAQTSSVRAVFESYGQIGTFSRDCAQEPSRSNSYIVRRARDDGFVQHDLMIGANQMGAAPMIIDFAEGRGPAEFAYSQKSEDGTVRMDYLVRVEPRRWRVLQMAENGKAIIADGRFTFGARAESSWMNNCN
jgi:hypothetical protein